MRRFKRITAFVLAFSLIIGFIPISYISRAAETENQYDETLLLEDDFSGDSWKNTASPEGYWRLNSTRNADLAGVLDTVKQTAPLGYHTACRNLYDANPEPKNMTDVHLQATVYVNEKTYGNLTNPQLQFLTARCNVYGATGIVFGFSTMPDAKVSSLIVGTYSGNDNVAPFVGGQTEAIYNTEQEYHLELYVVGNLVIAKCDGETIFEGDVSGIPASGYCGIIDRRATSNNASGTYGIDYVKGGYFDNFSIAKVNCFPTEKVVTGFDFADEKVRVKAGETLDSVSVIPVYAEPYGTGKPTSDGVSVSGFNKNQVGMQKVTVTYAGFSKEMIVSVYDESVEYMIDEQGFATEPFEQTEWKTAECYTNGYIEMSVALEEWTASQDGNLYPMTLFYKPDNTDTGIYTRFQVTKNGDEFTANLQTYTYRPGETSAHFAKGETLSDFAWGKEYKIRLSVIGNYYEVRVNDEIKVQRTLNPNEEINKPFITGEAYFGFRNIAGISATVDQLTVVKYTPFEVQTTETVNVQNYADFTTGSIYNERIAFLKNEQLEMIVEPPEGQQLSAVEGLVYYAGEDEEGPYPITDRLGEAGKNKECCNTFVLTMPATKLRIADKYYTKVSADGNVGIIGVSIREKTGSKKYGIRFSSRAYMDYIDERGKSYNLIEVGTLLFKERDEVSTEQCDACYASESNTLLDKYGNTIGKKVTATRAQDICDTYVDWGLILTYDDQTILFDVEYTTYSYAVYQAEDGTTVVKYGTNPKTYSYNQVAEKVGYTQQKASYLFYDVFSSDYREEWKFVKDAASTYDVQNGKLAIDYDAAMDKPSAVTGTVTGGEAWTDYAVSADVVFDSTTGISRGRSIGLTARNSGSYYYEFRLQYTESDSQMSAILYRFGKSTEVLKSLTQAKLKECLGDSTALGLDTQYNMRLEVRGSLIRCYVNGTRVIVVEDNSDNALTSGTAGLKSANNIATYEDFIVEAKEIQTIVGLQLSGPEATNNVVKLYEGFDIDLPSYRLKVMDEDGTYQTVALTQEMISEYDNTILGEHEITLTYKGLSYPAKVLISERPDELEAFEKAITDAKAAVDSSSVTAKAETINNLKEQYDSFSPYELTKVKAQALETYEELQEALERANDSNLNGYTKLLADSLNNVNEETWNDSIMGNSAKWISLNGTLYQAQTPYNMAVEGWHSPDVYGEIYSISADMTMLSENMNMGIAMNMSQTGCYYARVINTQENGETIYRVQLLKRTNTGYDHRPITYTAGYETLDLSLGQEFNLRMTLLNGVLTIYVDGVKVCTYDDSANNYQHTSGECGLRVLNGDGIYDNIRVYGKALEREDTGVADIKVQSYTDDFENETQGASPNLWQENYQATTVVDNWKVYQDGNTLVYGTQVTSGLTETWLHVFEKNPEFIAKFKVNSKSDDSEIGFITRRSPDTAFVNVGYDYKESKWYIASQESEAGGCEVFWAENTSELATEVWYTARLEASGKSVTLYINDNVVVSSDSVKHTGFGRLGFFTQNASMYVDDVDYTFKSGDRPQDGLLSYVIEPNKYSNYMEIESTDDGQTLVGVSGTTKKLSEDAGTTWKDITSNSTWAGLKTGNYPTLLELHDGTYIQIVQNEKFAVYSSNDMKTWTNIGQVVPEAEQTDSQGHSVAILHVNSATEVQFSDGSYRIFCPVAFRKYNDSGSILGHYTKVYYSDNGGASWECSETTTKEILPGYTDGDSTTWSESKIIKCSDGTLRMYYSRNYQGCMQYTVSRNKGKTWEGMYQIPELQCAMTSFAIIEDPTARGTYYMLWINGEANYLGSMLPRVRPCLLRSTDGMNWEFLMNCEYMSEVHSTTNGEALYQILDPSLYVTEDYVYVTFGRSEREFEVNNANSHQAQRCYYLRVQKDKLEARPWDASTVANMKYPKTIEISTMPQTEFKYNATFSFATGVLKITALDGTVKYEPMTKNCAIYNIPNMTASGWTTDAEETVIVYYMNGYKLSYDITIKKRLSL